MSQLDLFPAARSVPAHVEAIIGVEYGRRVLPADGTYHLYRSNVHEEDGKTHRVRVVGTEMRCGLVQMHSPTWHWPGFPVDEAHRNADPCPQCFPEAAS